MFAHYFLKAACLRESAKRGTESGEPYIGCMEGEALQGIMWQCAVEEERGKGKYGIGEEDSDDRWGTGKHMWEARKTKTVPSWRHGKWYEFGWTIALGGSAWSSHALQEFIAHQGRTGPCRILITHRSTVSSLALKMCGRACCMGGGA